MSNKHPKSRRTRRLRPTPALVVAFVALFAAMGGIGYAAVKLKPNSVTVEEHQGRRCDHRQDRRRRRDHAEAGAGRGRPERDERVNAMNAAKLGGVAPGGCQTGWLKASLVVDTDVAHAGTADGHGVPASTAPARRDGRGADPERSDVGRYTSSRSPAMTRRIAVVTERRRQRGHRRDEDR